MDFENQMFVELLSEDGLIILARGLGLDRLFLKFLKLYSDPHNLVLVLNTSSVQESHYKQELTTDNVDHLPRSITNEYSAKEREVLYLRGGVLFITSRILVVDLLRRQCPVDRVAGILVCNAHRVTDSSMEAFILRLYRQDNKSGFIKAFSDAPEPFTNGFCQLERVMRNLFLRHVYLWPRFHATVGASLSRHKPDVVELRQQMTPAMTAIQLSILDIMKACVAELKRTNPALDTDEVTVENCMSKSFDQVIKMQLDPVWNQLGPKTKQLVFDLRMLRTLLYFLTQYDCVTFYNYLESVRSGRSDSRAFSSHSAWVFMEASNTLFVKARERVYGALDSKSKAEKAASKAEDTAEEGLRLEESPKWHLLSMVLGEVHREGRSNTAMEGQGKILVVANDERTCYQLREYLCGGGHQLLQRQFQRLLACKQQVGATGAAQSSSATSETQTRYQLKKGPTASKRSASGSRGSSSSRPAKRKKLEAQKATEFDKEEKGESSQEEFEGSELDKLEENELFMAEMQFDSGGGLHAVQPRPAGEGEGQQFGVIAEPLVILHALNSSDDPYHLTKVLSELRPRYIIMYDAEMKFVRQIEVFKASNPGMPLRVYFLLYDSSIEEQKYLTSLRKEKEAFQQLIKERAHMVVPVDREGKVADSTLLQRDPSSAAAPELPRSRRAGGSVDKGPQTVIVDIREFRSTLPSLLHKRGIDIIPLTLEVGDYILTSDICVERKSVSDLIGSLNSGRLYNQATAMTRHYRKPVLLIEFSENRPFSLQSASAMHSEVSYQDISSKLVLLTLHFPNLRILWCPSPYATAELFEELKAGYSQPDPEVAVTVGQDTLEKTDSTTYSALAQDFLLKLPGINSKNLRFLMNKVKDMQELVSMSKQRLEEILGNDANAKLLWNFLHSELETQTASAKIRSIIRSK